MDKEYELFASWWNEPQQDELRKICAAGWGWKIWQASAGQKSSPQIIPGWKLVPIEPTEDMVIRGFESKPDEFWSAPDEWEAFEAMSGCQQAAHKARLCWAAMLAAVPEVGK